ncbi:hypothetical protein MRX96_036615 [Rhipicephalus microplus]
MMREVFAVVFVFSLCSTNVIQAKLGAPGGPMKLKLLHLPDSFKIISSWESALAIAVSDPTFDCMMANRTTIDYEAQTATFVWTLRETDRSPRQEVTFLVRPWTCTSHHRDVHPDVLEGIFYYMDDTCLVMDLEYQGHLCLLWVRNEAKDNIPQKCFAHFTDACGGPVHQRKKQLCPDV